MNSSDNIAPFFSVVITTYNRAGLLKRALDSLLGQSFKDWEAILIDDGSTDQTEEVVQPYIRQDTRIHYIKQLAGGATAAKNAGIMASCGKYITFLDSDDEYHPSHLERRGNFINEHPAVELIYGGVKVIGNPFVPDRHQYGAMVHLSDCVVGGTFFVKRSLMISMGGLYEMPLGSDADFFERTSQAGALAIKVPWPTYWYHRENLNSITNNLAGCQLLE